MRRAGKMKKPEGRKLPPAFDFACRKSGTICIIKA